MAGARSGHLQGGEPFMLVASMLKGFGKGITRSRLQGHRGTSSGPVAGEGSAE